MKEKKYNIHHDFRHWEHFYYPLNRFSLFFFRNILGQLFYLQSTNKDVRTKYIKIPTIDNKKVKCLIYEPKSIEDYAPCLIYFHGGGFVLPAGPYHYKYCRQYANKCNCKVIFVNYRLSPRHKFPDVLNDSFGVYKYVYDNANTFNINKNKIAFGGDSAGGSISISTSIKASEEKYPLPCGQLLIYPAVGINQETESMKLYTDTPMCNSNDIKKYLNFYFKNEEDKKHIYADPINYVNNLNTPQAYIETAEYDCLKDGAINYHNKLIENNINSTLYQTKQTMHGYDIVTKSSISKKSIEKRIEFLNSIFKK